MASTRGLESRCRVYDFCVEYGYNNCQRWLDELDGRTRRSSRRTLVRDLAKDVEPGKHLEFSLANATASTLKHGPHSLPLFAACQCASCFRTCGRTSIRWSQLGPLRGPGLAEALLGIAFRQLDGALPDIRLDVLLHLVARVDDWSNLKSATPLFKSVSRLLDDPRCRDLALDTLLKGVASLQVQDSTSCLIGLKQPEVRPRILRQIAESYLESPSIKQLLSHDDWGHVRDKVLEMAKERDPRIASQALKRLVDADDCYAIEAAEAALSHPPSNIRALAHRLLRRATTKARYLEATCFMLRDKQPELRRTAIRVLSFAGYEPGIKGIAELLHDRKKNVDKAAREGLIIYGGAAVPILKGLLSNTRPDKRAALLDVLAAIQCAEDNN